MSANHHFNLETTQEFAPLCRRARAVITDQLVFLLTSGGVRREVVDLARMTWLDEPDAIGRLSLLADAASVAAADELFAPSIGGALRIEALMRAASLASLMRLYVELLVCESSGAERVLEFAEELAWGDPASRSQSVSSQRVAVNTGWRSQVQALRAWVRMWVHPTR